LSSIDATRKPTLYRKANTQDQQNQQTIECLPNMILNNLLILGATATGVPKPHKSVAVRNSGVKITNCELLPIHYDSFIEAGRNPFIDIINDTVIVDGRQILVGECLMIDSPNARTFYGNNITFSGLITVGDGAGRPASIDDIMPNDSFKLENSVGNLGAYRHQMPTHSQAV
jgi:hypothetical protein